jgi:EAL domain-containing protein (putative c-di-GMP-specific phosphodiesterase class I)
MTEYSSDGSASSGAWKPDLAGVDAGMAQRKLRRRLLSVLRNQELEIAYQAAIRLDAPRVEFFEALARFRSEEGPDLWFAAAARAGLGPELEMLAARSAIAGLALLPEGSSISINVSPATILSPIFIEELDSAPLEQLILEITENEAIDSYEAIMDVLTPLRERGLRIAVDDVGAGYASFRHILQIRPDIIKLDVSICRGNHEDDARRALISALITFARQVGSELVAEGVETILELKSLRALGMTIVQGYVFARPASIGRMSDGQPSKESFRGVLRSLAKAA